MSRSRSGTYGSRRGRSSATRGRPPAAARRRGTEYRSRGRSAKPRPVYGRSPASRRAGGSGGRSNAAVLGSLVLVVAVLGGAAWVGVAVLGGLLGPAPDYPGPGRGQVVVEVRPGETLSEIGVTLEQAKVVKSAEAFEDEADSEPEATSLQPGHYSLRARMAAADALALMLDPASVVKDLVTIPEGSRLSEIVDAITSKSDLRRGDVVAALRDAGELGLPPYAKGHPEGYLFPATYVVDPNTTARSLVQDMIERFDQAAAEVSLESRARQGSISPAQAVVVASLVEGEARRAKDFGKVARVVYNRLEQGMRLQFDSTVNYALKADKTTVTAQDLGVASPYNTYRREGLPPAPISSPGQRALDAALNPPKGNWLYFVTVDEKGTTRFTSSYDEFLGFKAEYQRNRDGG